MLLKSNKLESNIYRHFNSLIYFLNMQKLRNITIAIFEMLTRRITCTSKPFIFRIDPCSLCNLRCVSCSSHKAITQEKRVMEFNDFTSIIDKIKKYALRVSLYDMGEPLVNKNIYKMIKYASEHKISTLISTNFNLFNEEHIDDLFNSKLTVLEPCLDGFTQESYAKYRVNGHVDLVKRGIQLVMDHKRKTKSRYPIVNVQIVLFDHIKHEIGDIEVFLKHNKVDQITYREENLGFNSPETTIVNRKGINRVCFWLYIGMMIRPDGNVYPCDGRGFNRFSYGSILKQDIAEIWNNKYFRFSRSLFTNGSDLDYDEEMRNIPCLSCKDYIKRRNMLLK